MDLDAYYRSFDDRVRDIVAYGYERSPAFRARLVAAGLTPADITTADALSRLPVLPKVPSLGETPALKGMDLQTWAVIFTPKGVPEAVQQKLNAAINTVLMQPGMAEQRRKLGSTLDATMTPAQSQAFVLRERDTYRPAASRVKPE